MRFLSVFVPGNGFKKEHVRWLFNSIKRNYSGTCSFFCLTNEYLDFCDTIPLKGFYPGWWNKIQMFRNDLVSDDLTVYFDLDTVILNDISALGNANVDFAMLDAFNLRGNGVKGNKEHASGIMMWRGDKTFLWDGLALGMDKHRGDQTYIEERLKKRGIFISSVNYYLNIKSYKGHCLNGLVPADVVCFHGKPRPWECEESWIWENMR
jgi:hypothetical protein